MSIRKILLLYLAVTVCFSLRLHQEENTIEGGESSNYDSSIDKFIRSALP
jgi:hypothetical protein